MREGAMLGLACALSLASCGARSGLEIAPPEPLDAAGVDAARPDAFVRDAWRMEAGPSCPFGWEDTVDATLRMTADDNFRLFVQGELIDDTPRIWNDVQTYPVRLFRHPERRNTIAVDTLNVMEIDGRDRGLLADLSADIGGPRTLVTDASWRIATMVPDGWTEVDFDASGWAPPTLEGMNGILPWGTLLGSSPAMWLWSYDSAIPASEKPEMERVLMRRDFYVDVSGALRDTPGSCP
jgi:hypothetical protein